MKVPILKQGDYLIVSIQTTLEDKDLQQLQLDLAERVGKYRSKGVVIDVTALDLIDSFAARTLQNISSMTKLRGAEMVLVGIHPDVALTMVQMGLTLQQTETALDLESGLELLIKKINKRMHYV